MPRPSPVTHVSDTARWVAMYRALESERPDALFQDPHARTLAGPEGAAILEAMPKGRKYSWPMVVRTAVMDEIILRTVQRDGADTVLNLAAGLDARPYRLPLPPSLRWIEADFPAVLEYKEEKLADARPQCVIERVRVDLTDASARAGLLRRVGTGGERTLVVSEGLLVYLTPDQVAQLARDLHAQPVVLWWLIDLASPRILKMLRKTWGKALASGGAPIHFGPAEGTAFFGPHGWHEIEYHPIFEESLRLGRTMRLARVWNVVGRLFPKKKREEMRRMSGVVVLGR